MPFLRAVTTDSGISLLNRAQSGEGTIVFTRMAIGDGIYSLEEKSEVLLKKSKNLKSLRNSYKLSATVKLNDNSIKTTAVISNQDPITKETVVNEGYYINEVGIFAKIYGDERDTLLSIAVTEGEKGDYIPAFTGHETAQIIQNFIVSISNGVNINLKYSDAAVAFQEDVDRQLSEFKNEISASQTELNKALAKAIKAIADYKGESVTTFNHDGSIVTINSLETITTNINKAEKSITSKHDFKNGLTKTLKTVFEGKTIRTTEVK